MPAVHDQAAEIETPGSTSHLFSLRHHPQLLNRGAARIRDALNKQCAELAWQHAQPRDAPADTWAVQHATVAPRVYPQLPRSPLAAGSWIVLIAWLAGSAIAFWYFELSDWRPFTPVEIHAFASADAAIVEQWFRSNVQSRMPADARTKVTFVHLYNPECRCNRFTEPHLQRLMQAFQPRGVRFIAALAPKSIAAAVAHAPFDMPLIRSQDSRLAAAGIDTAPAALMFDADGKLIYYGPYSDSAWCGSGGSLVDPALERALSGTKTMTAPPASRGCFCEW